MQGIISEVIRHSLADEAGIKAGEKLCSVDGVQVKDIIELSFYTTDSQVELEIEAADGKRRMVTIEKYPDEDLGLIFASAVFDKVRTCYNHCVFCFVEQMIPGMRPGLYVRDDDYRLSFLYGNFITMTNMKDEDFDRIISTHMSPLYVSVHTTTPEVRCDVMKNRFAGDLMDKLQRLFDGGIQVHTQNVLCPGYNDGKVLSKTFADLYALHPNVLTMAVVPVGITRHREHLTPLRTFTKEEAAAIVEEATQWQERCRRETGKSFVYLADEFYLLSDKEFPPVEWYDGFPQLENGIGLTRSFLTDWENTLKKLDEVEKQEPVKIPVGEGAIKVLKPLMDDFNAKFGTAHEFVAVPNKFFGGKVNVTGLLTGSDILNSLAEEKHIVLPNVVLNNDNLFLDDMTLEEFKARCKGRVEVALGAKELLHYLAG